MFRQFGGVEQSYIDSVQNDPTARAAFDTYLESMGINDKTERDKVINIQGSKDDKEQATELWGMYRISGAKGSLPGNRMVPLGSPGRLPGDLATYSADQIAQAKGASMDKIQALLACSNERECDRFGKEDIEAELSRRGYQFVNKKKAMTGPKEISNWATKPDLIDILLANNKNEIARIRLQEKQMRSGERRSAGTLPSQATNPAMYDHNTGLLYEKYLTQDHHGLTAYDFKGDKYEVVYRPLLNGEWGDAKWVKVTTSDVTACRKLSGGPFALDKRGLPLVSQLNYWNDFGATYKDKKKKTFQLICTNRRNTKDNSIHPENCKPNKSGKFTMRWVPASDKYPCRPPIKSASDRKFFLPDGSIVTGNELNKLSLEEIWRMMMLLELMEQGPEYAAKMQKLGLGPYAAADAKDKELQSLGLAGSKGRKRTLLDPMKRAQEENKFMEAGLGECGKDGRPAQRCYSDSYIPGACVPHQEICFYDTKHRKKFDATGTATGTWTGDDYREKWLKSNKYGQNPQLNWAKERSQELKDANALESEEAYNAFIAKEQMLAGQTDIPRRV